MINVAPVAATCKDIVPEAIAADVLECYKNGAAMVHLHVRAKDGSLTPDTALLEETLKLIRKDSDIIIEVSTGGISDLTIEERCAPVPLPLGKGVYVNRPEDVEYCVQQLLKYKKIPEVETFEIGHTNTMFELMQKYDFVKPVLFSVVLGHKGEAPATHKALAMMIDMIPEGAVWGITHSGRKDMGIFAAALGMGAKTVRVGFEDSDYLDPNTQVSTNAPIVKKAADLIRAMDKEVMTPAEARAFFKIGA